MVFRESNACLNRWQVCGQRCLLAAYGRRSDGRWARFPEQVCCRFSVRVAAEAVVLSVRRITDGKELVGATLPKDKTVEHKSLKHLARRDAHLPTVTWREAATRRNLFPAVRNEPERM